MSGMRRLLGILVLCALFGGALRAQEEADATTSTIERAGVTWSLTTTRTEATVMHGWPAELIRFTVRRDGKFAFSKTRFDGGRLIGALYRRDWSGLRLRPFPSENPVGWILSVDSHCGNTSGRRYLMITPDPRRLHEGHVPGYFQYEAESATAPVVTREGEDVLVWGAYQEWGGGGTASSTYVPYRHRVRPDGRIERARLPADPEAWPPAVEEGLRGFSPLGLFVAGLREQSPALMRAVLPRFDFTRAVGENSDLGDWCRSFGLPHTREGLDTVIEATEKIVAARATLRKHVTGPLVADPVD